VDDLNDWANSVGAFRSTKIPFTSIGKDCIYTLDGERIGEEASISVGAGVDVHTTVSNTTTVKKIHLVPVITKFFVRLAEELMK